MNNRKSKLASLFGAIVLAASLPASANPMLFGWGFNIDGTTYCSGGGCDNSGLGSLPGSVNTGGFDFVTGLGSIVITIDGVGPHSIDSFFDHDIDAGINTFFNESGATSGAAAAGQSWEIDEPGFFPFPNPFGDIFDNFLASTLDNAIFNPSGLIQDDVSMAMGWDFVLAAGEVAMITLDLSEVLAATSNLVLHQLDPDSGNNVFLTSTLSISGKPPVGVPEPGMLMLMGLGLAGLGLARRRQTQ